MKRFVAWARVSSARQKREGFSLEDQEARLTEFASRLGGSITKLYKLAETASKREERASFRDLTAYVKKHAASLHGVLFVKVDRAARNIRDWADLEELSERTGVPLFFPDQPTGETPAGRMQRRMSAVFASYQTDQQATDIKGGLRRRVENGLPLGRHFGYRSVRVNGRSTVEPDPINAPKVRRVFELFAYHQHTLESLADTLARQGIIYSDRKPRFHRATLYRMLNNRHYVGDVKFKGAWHPGKLPPLVDLATFQTVAKRLHRRVSTKPEITFAGKLITCGHCGRIVTGEKKFKTSPDGTVRNYSYYRCSMYALPDHPKVRLSEPEIDRQFRACFNSMRIDDPEVRSWFVEVLRARAHAGQDANVKHRAELQRQHGQVESKLKSLIELRMDGEISPDEYAAKRAELHERQTAIRLQLETTDHDDRDLADLAVKVFELSQSLTAKWLTADYHAKRELLDILCEKVVLNSEKLEIHLRKPFGALAEGFPVSKSGAEESRTPDF